MQECHVTRIEFFVAGSNAPEMLDACEESLDQIAILVQMGIVGPELFAVGARRDNRLCCAGPNELDQSIGIVAFVGDDRFGRNTGNQFGGVVDIGNLPGAQNQPQRIAQGIDCRVDFGAQPASGAPDRLRAFFLAAPEECWWARTMVLSTNTSSKSASSASVANTFSQTPLFDQRAKRVYTLFQSPNSAGRSRHGLPVRATHSTASTNSRLSAPVRPGSSALPGNIDSKRCHWSLRNHRRTILTLRKYQDVNRFRLKLTAPGHKILNVNRP